LKKYYALLLKNACFFKVNIFSKNPFSYPFQITFSGDFEPENAYREPPVISLNWSTIILTNERLALENTDQSLNKEILGGFQLAYSISELVKY
jgi:hypothetical protein